MRRLGYRTALVNSDVLRDFRRLFDGRTDIIGNGDNPAAPYRPGDLAPIVFYENHLTGKHPIGVYPMLNDNTVKWGCVDFDEGYEESWPDAFNVQAVLKEFGITAWTEKTRSKGWHVWVFLDDWFPSWEVRQALLAACQLVSAPTKEINPKQDVLSEDKPYGNFVRLPYPGHQTPEGRQTILMDEGHANVSVFLTRAMSQRTNPYKLLALKELYVPPTPKFIPAPFDYKPAETWPPLIRHILGEPPNISAQGGRSATMQRIAHLCRKEGLSYEDTKAAVWAYDEIWGKYKGRPDRDQRIKEIVDRAF